MTKQRLLYIIDKELEALYSYSPSTEFAEDAVERRIEYFEIIRNELINDEITVQEVLEELGVDFSKPIMFRGKRE